MERFRKVFEGAIDYSMEQGMRIEDPETTGGRTPIGDLLGVGGYGSPHAGKRFRILVEEIPDAVPGSTMGETEAEVSYEADFLEQRSRGPYWRTGAISGLEYKGTLENARRYRDGDVIGIRIREIGTTTTVVYEEHIDGRRFGE